MQNIYFLYLIRKKSNMIRIIDQTTVQYKHLTYKQGWPDRGGVGGVTPPNNRKLLFFLTKLEIFLIFCSENFTYTPPKFQYSPKNSEHPPNVICLGPPLSHRKNCLIACLLTCMSALH
jgi:hypothetical protein